MEGYEQYLRNRGFSDNSVRSYLYAAKQLDKRLKTLNNEELLAHKDWLIATYSAKTVNIRLVAINAYLDFKGYEGIRLAGLRIQQSPFLDNVISNEQYRAMVALLESESDMFWLFIVRFLACTGARVSELRKFSVANVGTGHMDIVSKGSKLRRIYIPSTLRKKAQDWCDSEGRSEGPLFDCGHGTAISSRGISLGLKRIAARCGIDESVVYPHSFRHLFAKNFIKRNPDIALLADLMGHESIETTRIYLRRTAVEQRAAVDEAIDW